MRMCSRETDACNQEPAGDASDGIHARVLECAGLVSDEVSHVHWHLLNLSAVEQLDVAQEPHIGPRHEVDRHAPKTEAAGSTNAVNVVFTVGGEVEVDHQRYKRRVNAAREEVGSDEYAG